jgi:signal transduction histidine kinase
MKIYLSFLFIGFVLLATSCKKAITDKRDMELTKSFQQFAKQYQYSNPVLFQKQIDSLRPFIQLNDPLITEYYYQKAKSVDNLTKMKLYADSCFNFFNTNKRIKDYEKNYLRALLIKGSFFFLSKHYSLALNYYFEGYQILEKGGYSCESAEFIGSIANIYFAQKRYSDAARNYQLNSRYLEKCGQINSEILFHGKQAALNNTGVSFERNGQLDSALFFYRKTLAFADSIEKVTSIEKKRIDLTRAISYDNIGGIYLKQNRLDSANLLLTKSLNMLGFTSTSIPPSLKLAEYFLIQKEYLKADSQLNISDHLLKQFDNDYTNNYRIIWYKLKSRYYLESNNIQLAFKYLSLHSQDKDSTDLSMVSLYSLNIDNEFRLLTREKELTELTQKEFINEIYLVAGSIILIMLVIISLLLYSNSKKNKKQNLNSKLQNNALQKALEKLELTNKNYIRILRVMAHDFKNPLVGISGVASILTADEPNPERKELLDLIEKSSTNAIHMINDLLKNGLAEDEEVLSKSKVNLHELLDSSIYLLKFNAAKKDQTIIYEIPDNIYVDVNQEKLWRVFNNLIINAIKFSYSGGTIKVGATIKDNSAIISIEDNGMGIPDVDKEHVFKMFSPAKKTGTAGEESFGLGLSISKKIVEIHNGKLWFEPNPNGGTIFYVSLPLSNS